MNYTEYVEWVERCEVAENVERMEMNFDWLMTVWLHTHDPFVKYCDRQFKRRYRFSKAGVESLYQRIGEHVSGVRSSDISPRLQLLAMLNFFARGGYQESVADIHVISQPSMSRILRKVVEALIRLKSEHISFSSDLMTIRNQMSEFYSIAGFPKVIGCIDCTHIKIRNPGDDALTYMNRKGFYSLNVQVVPGADLKIKNIVSRWRASTHDSRIFRFR